MYTITETQLIFDSVNVNDMSSRKAVNLNRAL